MGTVQLRSIVTGVTPGLAEVGKVKIGEKGQVRKSQYGKEFQPPQKLNHFKVTTLDRDQTGNFRQDNTVHGIYGPAPKELTVRLLFNQIDLNFQSRFVCYDGKTRFCTGDGERAIRRESGKDIEVACPCERLDRDFTPDRDGPGKCKIASCLSFLVDGVPRTGGVYKFRSTSWNTHQSILSSLTLISHLTQGNYAMLPLKLSVLPKTATTPSGQSTTIYVVSLEYEGTIESLRQISYDAAKAGAVFAARMERIEQETRKLIGYDPLEGETDSDVVEEFFPDQAEKDMQGVVDAEVIAPAAKQSSQEPATHEGASNGQSKPYTVQPKVTCPMDSGRPFAGKPLTQKYCESTCEQYPCKAWKASSPNGGTNAPLGQSNQAQTQSQAQPQSATGGNACQQPADTQSKASSQTATSEPETPPKLDDALKIALFWQQGARERWVERVQSGMEDPHLLNAIKKEFGEGGHEMIMGVQAIWRIVDGEPVLTFGRERISSFGLIEEVRGYLKIPYPQKKQEQPPQANGNGQQEEKGGFRRRANNFEVNPNDFNGNAKIQTCGVTPDQLLVIREHVNAVQGAKDATLAYIAKLGIKELSYLRPAEASELIQELRELRELKNRTLQNAGPSDPEPPPPAPASDMPTDLIDCPMSGDRLSESRYCRAGKCQMRLQDGWCPAIDDPPAKVQI